jgi:hypothetical protein
LETLIQNLAAAISRRCGAIERFQAGLKNRVGLRLGLNLGDAPFQPSEHIEPHRLYWRRIVQPIAAG